MAKKDTGPCLVACCEMGPREELGVGMVVSERACLIETGRGAWFCAVFVPCDRSVGWLDALDIFLGGGASGDGIGHWILLTACDADWNRAVVSTIL